MILGTYARLLQFAPAVKVLAVVGAAGLMLAGVDGCRTEW
jgi:hypothetical protein